MVLGEAGAFYAAVAGSSAAIFGVGAAVLATRYVTLAERAFVLSMEHGDYTNEAISSGSQALQKEWARRARRNALADLHKIVGRLKWTVGWPLGSAVVLVVLALAPLVGWPPDSAWYRLGLLFLFALVALVWIRFLGRFAANLSAFTRRFHDEREKERQDGTAAGLPPIVSGDLEAGVDNIVRAVPQIAKTLRGRKWLKKIRKRLREPPRI